MKKKYIVLKKGGALFCFKIKRIETYNDLLKNIVQHIKPDKVQKYIKLITNKRTYTRMQKLSKLFKSSDYSCIDHLADLTYKFLNDTARQVYSVNPEIPQYISITKNGNKILIFLIYIFLKKFYVHIDNHKMIEEIIKLNSELNFTQSGFFSYLGRSVKSAVNDIQKFGPGSKPTTPTTDTTDIYEQTKNKLTEIYKKINELIKALYQTVTGNTSNKIISDIKTKLESKPSSYDSINSIIKDFLTLYDYMTIYIAHKARKNKLNNIQKHKKKQQIMNESNNASLKAIEHNLSTQIYKDFSNLYKEYASIYDTIFKLLQRKANAHLSGQLLLLHKDFTTFYETLIKDKTYTKENIETFKLYIAKLKSISQLLTGESTQEKHPILTYFKLYFKNIFKPNTLYIIDEEKLKSMHSDDLVNIFNRMNPMDIQFIKIHNDDKVYKLFITFFTKLINDPGLSKITDKLHYMKKIKKDILVTIMFRIFDNLYFNTKILQNSLKKSYHNPKNNTLKFIYSNMNYTSKQLINFNFTPKNNIIKTESPKTTTTESTKTNTETPKTNVPSKNNKSINIEKKILDIIIHIIQTLYILYKSSILTDFYHNNYLYFLLIINFYLNSNLNTIYTNQDVRDEFIQTIINIYIDNNGNSTTIKNKLITIPIHIFNLLISIHHQQKLNSKFILIYLKNFNVTETNTKMLVFNDKCILVLFDHLYKTNHDIKSIHLLIRNHILSQIDLIIFIEIINQIKTNVTTKTTNIIEIYNFFILFIDSKIETLKFKFSIDNKLFEEYYTISSKSNPIKSSTLLIYNLLYIFYYKKTLLELKADVNKETKKKELKSFNYYYIYKFIFINSTNRLLLFICILFSSFIIDNIIDNLTETNTEKYNKLLSHLQTRTITIIFKNILSDIKQKLILPLLQLDINKNNEDNYKYLFYYYVFIYLSHITKQHTDLLNKLTIDLNTNKHYYYLMILGYLTLMNTKMSAADTNKELINEVLTKANSIKSSNISIQFSSNIGVEISSIISTSYKFYDFQPSYENPEISTTGGSNELYQSGGDSNSLVIINTSSTSDNDIQFHDIFKKIYKKEDVDITTINFKNNDKITELYPDTPVTNDTINKHLEDNKNCYKNILCFANYFFQLNFNQYNTKPDESSTETSTSTEAIDTLPTASAPDTTTTVYLNDLNNKTIKFKYGNKSYDINITSTIEYNTEVNILSLEESFKTITDINNYKSNKNKFIYYCICYEKIMMSYFNTINNFIYDKIIYLYIYGNYLKYVDKTNFLVGYYICYCMNIILNIIINSNINKNIIEVLINNFIKNNFYINKTLNDDHIKAEKNRINNLLLMELIFINTNYKTQKIDVLVQNTSNYYNLLLIFLNDNYFNHNIIELILKNNFDSLDIKEPNAISTTPPHTEENTDSILLDFLRINKKDFENIFQNYCLTNISIFVIFKINSTKTPPPVVSGGYTKKKKIISTIHNKTKKLIKY